MSDQWGQQPSPPPNQQQWGQQSIPNQQPWGQQPPPPPNQQQWGQQSIPDQQPWGRQPTLNQQSWGQQPPNYGWQQQTLYPGQFQPQQSQPKTKKNRLGLILGIVCGALVLCGVMGSFSSGTSNSQNATVAQLSTPVNASTKVAQVIQPTVKPTATPTPTETPAKIEADYKSSTTSTTVTNLDKDGSADQGEEVHFVGQILAFVKDSTGQTAGANVSDPDSNSTSVIQVVFAAGIDITQLNQGDMLEVWGTDQGVFSGANAFGGTVQEVGITVKYMKDQTTNYQANIHTNPLAILRIAYQA